MAAHRGGKKRSYKKVGRQSAKKPYKNHCKIQIQAGMTNSASGKWITANLSDLQSRGLFGH